MSFASNLDLLRLEAIKFGQVAHWRGDEMANIVGLRSTDARRGRPRRSAVVAMRTAAWSRAVLLAAGETTPAGLARRVSDSRMGRDQVALDEAEIRDYMAGAHAPVTRLAPFERLFPGTRAVFDVGPEGLPLWAALEGELPSPVFSRVVDADVLPAGDVPLYCWLNLSPARMGTWFRDSVDLSCPQASPELSHVYAFCAAVYLDRWHERLGTTSCWRYMLIKATLMHPTSKEYLHRFGLFDRLVEWVELRELRRLEANDRARLHIEELLEQRGLVGGTATYLSDPVLFASLGSPIFGDHEQCDEGFVEYFCDLAVRALLDEGFDELAHRVRCSRRNGSTTIAKAVVELGDQVLGPQVRVPLEHLH
jgi:hypothetical protein